MSSARNPDTARPDARNTLSELAAAIDRQGIALIDQIPTNQVLASLADRALTTGLATEVADVLLDRRAPEVARARAFGRLHRHLCAPRQPRLQTANSRTVHSKKVDSNTVAA